MKFVGDMVLMLLDLCCFMVNCIRMYFEKYSDGFGCFSFVLNHNSRSFGNSNHQLNL